MKYIIYTDKSGEYRWQLKARNGKIIADSAEGYKSYAKCRNMIDKIQKGGHPIIEK